ncbi:MAG: YkvI family membrane protein [Steroidobacteraceae bacterium]
MTGAGVSSRFQRFLLPGFAFKAVVIGGGYATGRELAEFFLPSGPWGGLAGMLLAMAIWSAVCIVTFLFARASGARDYLTFVRALLGPGWVVFEAAYLLFVILILAVFGAAAGAIAEATLGVHRIFGTLALLTGIALFAAFGNTSVERLFKYVTFLLYGVYVLFVLLALTRFGGRIAQGFSAPASMDGWALGGLTYASYNVIGAIVILPVLRHLTSDRDAVIAGLIAGPLAMIPALLFFTCMLAYYPQVTTATLPSDFLLQRLNLPLFHLLFQLMIFAALLESGTGAVHAINERINHAWQARRRAALSDSARLSIALALLVGCMLLAERFGLVALIATGYRALACVILAVYVLPLMTLGTARLWRRRTLQEEIP